LRELVADQQRLLNERVAHEEELKREMAALKVEQLDTRAAVDAGRAQTKSLIAGLRGEYDALTQRGQATQNVLKKVYEQQQQLHQSLTAVQADVKQSRQAVGGLHNEVQALKKGLHVLHSLQKVVRQALEKIEVDLVAGQSERDVLQLDVARLKSALKSTRAALMQVRAGGVSERVKGVVSRLELATAPGTFTIIRLNQALRFDRDHHEVVVWRGNGDFERLWALTGEEDPLSWCCPLDPEESPPLVLGLAQDGVCVGAWWSPEWLRGLPRLLENAAEEAFLLLRWFELPVAEAEAEEALLELLQSHLAAALIAWKPEMAEWPSQGARMEPSAWLSQAARLLASLNFEKMAVETALHHLQLEQSDQAPEHRTDWLPAFESLDAELGAKLRGALGVGNAQSSF
jgi:hypothetical protein